MDKEKYEITGRFYTKSDGPLEGKAYTYGGNWYILTNDGRKLNRSTIFLDREKQVEAPNSTAMKGNWRKYVLGLVEKYEKQIESMESCDNLDKISGTYNMKMKMAKAYLQEYKKIYYDHFESNTIKFLLEDWLLDD
jgi:hypothetical protein